MSSPKCPSGLPLRAFLLRVARRRASPVLLLLALVLALVVPRAARAAEAADTSVELQDGWRYRWGDAPPGPRGVPAWALDAGEGPGWQPAEALRTPPGRDGARLLWLSLPLPEGPWRSPALLLGGVSNVVELYVGGERVHVSGTLDPEGYEAAESSAWQVVPLPRAALGRRVLLRIQSSGGAIGLRGEARLGELDTLHTRALRGAMAPFVIGALLLVVAVAACVLFLLQGRARRVGALAAFTLGAGLALALMSGVPQSLWGVGRAGYVLMLAGTYLAVPALCDFLQSAVLRTQARWRQRAVRGLYVFALVAALASPGVPGALPRVFPLFLVAMVVSLAGCLVLAAREAARGNPDARLFVAGLAGLLAASVLSALTAFGVLHSVGFVFHWGVLALTASLLALLARRADEVVRELAAQAQALRAQQSVVEGLAERLGSGASELVVAVGQLRATSSAQNEGVERQSAALIEAQATMHEIRQTSHVTSSNALRLAAATADADAAGRAGLDAIAHTLAGLEDIRHEVSGMARRILALEERTREASSIVEAVQELSDQSHLLAVNAALEAARGGEAGKGFAVVAREMRHLANQSLSATARIRNILEGVGHTMTEVAATSARGEERVRQSVAALGESSEQLQRLARMVGTSGSSVRDVTGAVAQQDAGIQQISVAINDLSDQMQRTLVALRETESVTHAVEQLAHSMSGTAGRALGARAGG